MLTEFEKDLVISRLEGWELVEFLQIPIEEVLDIALSEYWINQQNVSDVRELIGVSSNDYDDDDK
jgi:hypothetical protein